MFGVSDKSYSSYLSGGRECLPRRQMQLAWPRSQLVEGGSEFEAVLKEVDSREHVEAQAGTRHGYDQPTHVPARRYK